MNRPEGAADRVAPAGTAEDTQRADSLDDRGDAGKQRRGRGKARATIELIEACQEILAEIQPATVRAVCYRLFTMGLIPDMSKNSTNKVGTQIVWAREQGHIPWAWVVDETREAERINTWSNSDAIIRAAVTTYRRDYWQDQPNRVEVWSEKGTVRGTIAPVLNDLGVTFRVMHGFASATTINTIAEESIDDPRPFVALYVGDFDPSGMFMSEVDLPERMGRYGGEVTIGRIALLRDDLDGLPHFDVATKIGDTRHDWFVKRYGKRCWELDAMSPNLLRERVRASILDYVDQDAWDRAVEVERAEVESMHQFHAEWKRRISGPASKYPTDGRAS